jgi:uncharacterized protein
MMCLKSSVGNADWRRSALSKEKIRKTDIARIFPTIFIPMKNYRDSLIVMLGFLPCFLHADTTTVDSNVLVIKHALWQTTVTEDYDPSYVKLAYPGGDVPIETGVCTDVMVRAYRAVGLDLQKLIHEDMIDNFSAYPKDWGLKRPDANIDHRRVQNIAIYLTRHGKKLPVSDSAKDYKPGDLVTWLLGGRIQHIGIVSNVLVESADRFKMVHNIGGGTRCEDVLFHYEIIGHYRYFDGRKH